MPNCKQNEVSHSAAVMDLAYHIHGQLLKQSTLSVACILAVIDTDGLECVLQSHWWVGRAVEGCEMVLTPYN